MDSVPNSSLILLWALAVAGFQLPFIFSLPYVMRTFSYIATVSGERFSNMFNAAVGVVCMAYVIARQVALFSFFQTFMDSFRVCSVLPYHRRICYNTDSENTHHRFGQYTTRFDPLLALLLEGQKISYQIRNQGFIKPP